MQLKLRAVFFFLCSIILLAEAKERSCEEVFSDVYENCVWGIAEDGDPSSGFGSHYEYALPYVEFLQNFLEQHSIKKVVDLGCGAWEFARYIDWNGIDVIGIDVSDKIISINQSKFGNDRIRFECGDILNMHLPEGDLMVCKDVLQHLQNQDIALFISKIKKYKYCLLTNDIAISPQDDMRIHGKNRENAWRGANRPLDLTLPPFNLEGAKVLTYSLGHHVKQVLYITH